MAVNQVGLAKLVKAHYGKALKKENRDESGAFEVFGSSGQVGFHTDVLCDYPTLIIGRKGSVGEVSWAPRGGWIIDTAYYLEILDSGKLDLRYLFYALRKANLAKKTITTSIPGLNRDDFYDTKIPLPSLPEQKRIAAILDKADSLRRKNQQAIQLADQFLRAVFLDMFGDPETNPKGWSKMSLGSLCDRITDGTHQPPKFQESGIPFIFISNIVRGELTFETSKFISDETYTELTRRCPIEIGDVLYTTVGSYGVPVKVDTERKFSFQRHIAHIKPNPDILDSDFLVGMLCTPSLKAQADAAARGIAQKTVNLGEIRNFQVIVPPLKDQQVFASKVTAVRAIQFQQYEAAAKAEATSAALLGQTFN